MDTTAFLNYLQEQPDYSGQIVHVEHVPPRRARFDRLDEPLSPELQRRLESAGFDAMAVAAHPGYSATNLQQHSGIFSLLNHVMAQSQVMGALPTVYAATASGVNGGEYFGPDGFMAQRGYPKKVTSNKRSHDEAVAKRLWEVSEELTGVTYEF